MILPDSGIWIDLLVNRSTPQTRQLTDLISSRFTVGVADLVLTEVLQGTRSEAHYEQTAVFLAHFPQVTIVDRQVALAAARNYRALRTLGVTPRKTIDTLIATRCIVDDLPLLYADRDFDPFVQHLGLRSAMDLTPKAT